VIQLRPTLGCGMGSHCSPSLDASRAVPNAVRLQDSGGSLSERRGVRYLAGQLCSRHSIGDVKKHGIDIPSGFVSLAIVIGCSVIHGGW